MADYMWLKVPDDLILCDRSSWTSLGGDLYGTVRKLYLLVANRSNYTEDGPILFERTLPVGSEIKYERKHSIVTKNTLTITSSVQRAVTTKLASEVVSKLNTELGLLPLPPTAKITSELQSKISSEFTETLTDQLVGTRSYEVSRVEEFTSSLSLKTPGKQEQSQRHYFFLPVWRWTWDIYLFSQETLTFSYRREWLIRKVRDSYNYTQEIVKIPLGRVAFYEPQDDFPSMRSGAFNPTVTDAAAVIVEPLLSPCPATNNRDHMTLKELAEIAFPVSKTEKARAQRVQTKLPKKKTRIDEFVDKLTGPDKRFERDVSGKAGKGGAGKSTAKKSVAQKTKKGITSKKSSVSKKSATSGRSSKARSLSSTRGSKSPPKSGSGKWGSTPPGMARWRSSGSGGKGR